MPGLDDETREMILDTLKKYAERKLTPDYLIELDHNDEFPRQVLQELYDPMQLGLHLLFIPEAYKVDKPIQGDHHGCGSQIPGSGRGVRHFLASAGAFT